jgi:hypothetical protein
MRLIGSVCLIILQDNVTCLRSRWTKRSTLVSDKIDIYALLRLRLMTQIQQ